MGFLSRLRPPKDLSTTSPRDIVHFLIWKDKDAKTQVHKEGCPHFGSSSKITKGCDCPKRLAFKTVDSLIGQLRAILRDHRTTVHSPFDMSLPNPASHIIVKRYLKALTEEQLQARVLPQQAEPFFVHDLMILCSKIEGLLKGPATDPSHVFIYARDLAYFKLHFFSGDRPSDLSHIRTEEIMRFPQDKGLLFNHVFGKTLRSGDSNIFGIQRHPNVSLCPVKGIDDYMAVSHALGISLTSGYLFRTTQGNVVTSHPFPSDAAEARLKTYLADLPIGKKTLYSFRCGSAITMALTGSSLEDIIEHVGWKSPRMATYYMQLLKTMGPDAISAKMNSATQDTTEHYNSMNELLLFEPAYSSPST